MQKTKITKLGRNKIADRLGVPIEAICPECGQLMKPVYENNGFTEPDGPSRYEIISFKCSCGYKA